MQTESGENTALETYTYSQFDKKGHWEKIYMTSALLPNPVSNQAAAERPSQNKNEGKYKSMCK